MLSSLHLTWLNMPSSPQMGFSVWRLSWESGSALFLSQFMFLEQR